MEHNEKTMEKLAEDVRLTYRHLYWAAGHLAKIYAHLRPEQAEDVQEDPRQLKLFGEVEETEEYGQ